jgi:hypothetical protein
MAISLIMDSKKGMGALQLKQHLGLGSYQTPWHMTHRIRKAMRDSLGSPLKGIVEIDETYIGGKAKRRSGRVRNQKPRAEKFDMVIAMRERKGRVKFVPIPDGKAATIRATVEQHVDPFVDRIYTDGAAVYDFSLHEGFRRKHRAVNQNPVGCSRFAHSHEHSREQLFIVKARIDGELSSGFDKAPVSLSQ